MNTPQIETESLILRKFTTDDLESIFQIFSDKEVNRFLPWFPLNTFDDTQKFYEEHFERKYGQEHAYSYAVCLRGADDPMGYVNVDTDDSRDFGYGLRREFWHRGIMTQACKAVIEQLRRDGIPYITATHDINNPRSGEVMKRLGMKYRYSYEERWQPKDILVTFRMYQLNLDGQNDRVYQKYWNLYDKHFIETDV